MFSKNIFHIYKRVVINNYLIKKIEKHLLQVVKNVVLFHNFEATIISNVTQGEFETETKNISSSQTR